VQWDWQKIQETGERTFADFRESLPPFGQHALDASLEWVMRKDERITQEVALRSLITLVVLCILGHTIVASFSFLRRWLAGARVRDLLAYGCYEWLPGRGIHFIVVGCLWTFMIGCGLAIAAAGLRILAQFDESKTPDWKSAIAMLIGTGLVFLVARGLYRLYSATFIEVKNVNLPQVKVSVRSIRSLRDAGDTSRIGTEKFPNHISPFFGIGLLTRHILRLSVFLAFLLQLFVAIPLDIKTEQRVDWLEQLSQWQGQLRAIYHTHIDTIRSWDLPKSSCLVGIYFCMGLLLMLLNSNRHYLLIRFPQAMLYSLMLAAAVWIQVCNLGQVGEWDLAIVYAAMLVLLWLLGRRWNQDLKLAATYRRTKKYLNPISDLIRNAIHVFLDRVQKDRYCRLPELDAVQLSERITRGAHNIEESDPLVTRFFGRFMRVARVAAERCSTASLRFMTINRFTELGNYWPSYGPLVEPSVPMWDESIFPIHPPEGFATCRDSIRLPDCYNPIYYCPPTETRTETYYETESYYEWDSSTNSNVYKTRTVQKTREIQVTCSKCNGTSRLEYARYLITTWQTHRPTIVSPHMSMPELVEYAEETLYFRRPMVEHGVILNGEADICVGESRLQDEMRRAGERLAAKTDALCKRIVELTKDRYVYRADFIVGGLQAMNIRFAFLRSRSGWFFGKRPEFHFPKLPIGWATISTWLFLSPIALLIWLGIAAAMLVPLSWVCNGQLFPGG
jgi:hypothetical protein